MCITTFNGGAWTASQRHLATLGSAWPERGVVLTQEHKLVAEADMKEQAETLCGAGWKSI